jgi:hypothetical protein
MFEVPRRSGFLSYPTGSEAVSSVAAAEAGIEYNTIRNSIAILVKYKIVNPLST